MWKDGDDFTVGCWEFAEGRTVCRSSPVRMTTPTHYYTRYANMDYTFGASVKAALSPSPLVPLLLISYDIACQWFTNLFSRMDNHWPEHIKLPTTTKIIPAIPKLHEPMHEAANHQVYSLNYIPGVGLSDCECPERVWGPHNILGNSTKTQGPGSCQDVLDDHFSFWNWQKYIGLGKASARKYKVAVAERNIQTEGHRGFTASLEEATVAKWETTCIDWEQDELPKTKPNPYHIEGTCRYSNVRYLHLTDILLVATTEAQVRKELAAEEEHHLRDGGISLNDTTPSGFLTSGLDLEDTQ